MDPVVASFVLVAVMALSPAVYLVARHPWSFFHVLLAAIVGGMVGFPLPLLYLIQVGGRDTGAALAVMIGTPIASVLMALAAVFLQSSVELLVRAYRHRRSMRQGARPA
jgi:hypothetical protein